MRFINKGKKMADIQARNKIIEHMKGRLKRKFEHDIPVRNIIYEDINGIYLTFPNAVGKTRFLIELKIKKKPIRMI